MEDLYYPCKLVYVFLCFSIFYFSARQCIHDHRNPVIKLNSCLKLFFAAKTPEEEQVVNKQYIQLRRILDHKRVEKR